MTRIPGFTVQNTSPSLTPKKKYLSQVWDTSHSFHGDGIHDKNPRPTKLFLHGDLSVDLSPNKSCHQRASLAAVGMGGICFPFRTKVCSAVQYAWLSKGCGKHPFPRVSCLQHSGYIYEKLHLV